MLRTRLLKEGLSYAHEALEDAEETAVELLDDVENLFAAPLEDGEDAMEWNLLEPAEFNGDTTIGDVVASGNEASDFQFRKEVLRTGAAKYVSRKLNDSLYYFDDLKEWPLCLVVEEQQWTEGHLQVIQCLLEAGKDPNEGHGGWQSPSPWTKFIQRTCQEEYKGRLLESSRNGLVLGVLHHGAARNARVELFGFAEPAVLDAMSCFIEMLFARHARHSDKALRILEAFLDLVSWRGYF